MGLGGQGIRRARPGRERFIRPRLPARSSSSANGDRPPRRDRRPKGSRACRRIETPGSRRGRSAGRDQGEAEAGRPGHHVRDRVRAVDGRLPRRMVRRHGAPLCEHDPERRDAPVRRPRGRGHHRRRMGGPFRAASASGRLPRPVCSGGSSGARSGGRSTSNCCRRSSSLRRRGPRRR